MSATVRSFRHRHLVEASAGHVVLSLQLAMPALEPLQVVPKRGRKPVGLRISGRTINLT
jgi:hypothetical protein